MHEWIHAVNQFIYLVSTTYNLNVFVRNTRPFTEKRMFI
jgi:hypothetical protein